jgi:hypothetical protein
MSGQTAVPPTIDVDVTESTTATLSDTGENIYRALQAVKRELLEDNVRPGIECPADFGRGWCRHIAAEVYDWLGEPDDIHVLFSGSIGGNHFWIESDGQHFDAEKPCGVNDWRSPPRDTEIQDH